MRVKCFTCTHTVTARDEETGRAYLRLNHWCEHAPVDPDNDPRRPRDDAHADRVEAARMGATPAQLDGQACIRCGRDDTPMVPVGHVGGVQVFACTPTCPPPKKD